MTEIIEAPKALEEERFVLASLVLLPELLSGANLSPDCFYSTANKKVFGVLTRMAKSKIPVDSMSFCEAIKKISPQDEVEVMAAFDMLLYDSASSPNLDYHVKILKEKANLRKLLTGSYELQNQINAGVSLDELAQSLEGLKKSIVGTSDFTKNVYVPTWDNCPDDTEPLIELSNTRILSRGNISMLTAAAGAGKSSVLEAACSSMLAPMNDTLGLSLSAKSLLYIDTERSRSDHNHSWQRALKRAGIEPGATIPPEIQWENIKSIESLKNRLQYLWARIDVETVPELVLLDGIGDLVADVNDSAECTDLIYRISAIADVRNIGILLTLHNNPAMNSDKARGILGSELWRKCESVLVIKKLEDDIRCLTTDYALGKNRSASDTLASYFKWDNDQKMHVSCDAPAGEKGKTVCERDKILELVGKEKAWVYTDLTTAIMELTGKGIRASKYKISDLITLKKIVKNEDLTYSLVGKIQPKSPDYYHE